MLEFLDRVRWNLYLLLQLRGQKQIPFYSADEIARLRRRRLARMVWHAYRSVPFYTDTMRRLGLTPEQFRDVADLRRLPVVEKSDLQRDPEAFCSRAIPARNLLRLASSGSTGAPKTVYHDLAGLFQNAAHGERDRAPVLPLLGRWSGYRETVLVAPVNGSQRLIQQFCQQRGYFPKNVRVRRQYLLLSDAADANLAKLNEFQPDLLYSYGSYLDMLVGAVRRSGGNWHRPKVAVYNSDNLPLPSRRWFEENGIPVFSIYGSVEALKIGFECEHHQGLHVNEDLYPMRVVTHQGRDAAAGESGEVILSNLVNRGTVLLNYRLGDLVTVLEPGCPCGRNLPRISHPIGRIDEVLHAPGGETIHPIRFREIMNHIPGIGQFQVRQQKDGSVNVTLVATPDADRDMVRRTVLANMEHEFGGMLPALVAFADAVERTPSGKTPAVIAYHAAKAASAGRREAQ